ncbi:MAG: sporulation membrane protein YtaF [Symbiobacteriia bacterium]
MTVWSLGGDALLSVLLFALSLSLDSLSVGLIYGARGLRIGLSARLILGLASMCLSGLSLVLGSAVAGVAPFFPARVVGALVLVALGAAMTLRATRPEQAAPPAADQAGFAPEPPRPLQIRLRPLGLVIQIIREPVAADVDRSGEVTPVESLALGLALAVDSLAAGFGAALAGYQSWLLPLAVGLACTLLFSLGYRLGQRAALRLTGRAALIPGFFLMGLGLIRLF